MTSVQVAKFSVPLQDQQLSLVEETEAFLRSALARAEKKIEEDEREIEHLRAQIEKLRRMLFG
ncbi:IS66 family transposase, partial [Escherichia coli]